MITIRWYFPTAHLSRFYIVVNWINLPDRDVLSSGIFFLTGLATKLFQTVRPKGPIKDISCEY